jgi:DNA primase
MTMTILGLLREDGFELKKTACTDGGEFSGACPFCANGKDRFRVWPSSGRYWCRVCGQSGDTIQYLRDYRKLTYPEACKVIGRTPAERTADAKPQDLGTGPLAWKTVDAIAPPAVWQKRARKILDRAIELFWSQAGAQTRAFLRCEKGLQDAICGKAGLGFIPNDFYEPGAKWGLSTGKEIRIPAGLLIPTFDSDGQVIRLRVRRFTLAGKRYELIAASDGKTPMIIGADGQAAVIIVESELDALLLAQEVGDLCTAVALGTAGGKPDTGLHGLLSAEGTRQILISHDTDAAGARAAWAFFPKTYGKKALRWPCIKGKDPSEAWHNGLHIRQWVIAGLCSTEGRHERFCIQTMDGGLSDGQAMREILSL